MLKHIKSHFSNKYFFSSFVFISLWFTSSVFSIDINQYSFDNRPASPISDRWIEPNTVPNPICLTVADADGGPLVVTISSSNPQILPNDNFHLSIEGIGQKYIANTGPGESKHLTALVYPALNQTGVCKITFKVTDPGGLFATKSCTVTVTTAENIPLAYIDKTGYKLRQSVAQINTLCLMKDGEGTINVNGQNYELPDVLSMPSNSVLYPQAIPATGWQFVYWSGDVVDSQNPLKVTLSQNQSIMARFIQLESPDETSTTFQLNPCQTQIELYAGDQYLNEIIIGMDHQALELSPPEIDASHMTIQDKHNNDVKSLTDIRSIANETEQWKLLITNSDLDQSMPFILKWDQTTLCDGHFSLWVNDALNGEPLVPDMKSVDSYTLGSFSDHTVIVILWNMNE